MRHKYDTRGIVLARTHSGEANTFVTIITPELGLVYARAQSLRHSGAKLAAALPTFAQSSVVLVRGKDSWRIAGAVLGTNWSTRLTSLSAREAAGRISALLLRLVAGEANDSKLFPIVESYFAALAALPQESWDSAEVLAALRVLRALGLDAGEIPGGDSDFTSTVIDQVAVARTEYISRINRGILASGL